jgi:hypothetical protein
VTATTSTIAITPGAEFTNPGRDVWQAVCDTKANFWADVTYRTEGMDLSKAVYSIFPHRTYIHEWDYGPGRSGWLIVADGVMHGVDVEWMRQYDPDAQVILKISEHGNERLPR